VACRLEQVLTSHLPVDRCTTILVIFANMTVIVIGLDRLVNGSYQFGRPCVSRKQRICECACLVHVRKPYCHRYPYGIYPRSGIGGEEGVDSHEDANCDNIGGLALMG
jgi:hypothetical protein